MLLGADPLPKTLDDPGALDVAATIAHLHLLRRRENAGTQRAVGVAGPLARKGGSRPSIQAKVVWV